jgi:hypothetical protein
MIKHVTNLNIKGGTSHGAYKSSTGKIEQLLKIGSHSTGETPKGPFPGNYPIQGPSDVGVSSSHSLPSPSHAPSQAPSSSHGPLPTHGATHTYGIPKSKTGSFGFLAQGLFACFNMFHQNAQAIDDMRTWMAKEFHLNERRQKEMYAKMNMPCSPVREPRVFPPFSHIENPWENSRSYVPVDAIEEEDHGDSGSHHDDDETEEEEEEGDVGEDEDDEEEEDVLATDEDEDED